MKVYSRKIIFSHKKKVLIKDANAHVIKRDPTQDRKF